MPPPATRPSSSLIQIPSTQPQDITIALDPLKLSTKTYHGVLYAWLDGFEIRLSAIEQSGSSSDTGSLWTELQELRVVLQALQARDHVTLEDPPPSRHVDILEFITFQQLDDDNDSLVATAADVRGKGKEM
ncbi:hypothetical protein K7X08_029794 [Anisodus acutangulus]|uniref:Uncharacterized protein n=1 Tax=Anisodus acutangulus TaxID=402998 RepID=A0A9Q1MH31_9SOLA|nr:hypothetical protein K7X08_029794 [Anisodus acutangulus]